VPVAPSCPASWKLRFSSASISGSAVGYDILKKAIADARAKS
jgi:hypothetical protein